MKYIAFLRGINVGGVKIKMAELKKDFEHHGLTAVQTILNTGNVIFSSDSKPNLTFLPAKTFLLTDEAVRTVFEQNPFEKSDAMHTYALICTSEFADEVQNFPMDNEEAVKVVNGTVYWQVPIGFTTTTAFAKETAKKKYSDQFTSRNLNTIEKIIKKL
jgi:uncharacterized protein (DUF1697 family)